MTTITANPTRSECQRLVANAHFWAIIDALGISRDDLIRHELTPMTFACDGFRVKRDPTGAYLAWRRRTLSEDAERDTWGTSRPIVGHSEQEAGDALLEFAGLGRSAHGEALRRWLQLWGWEPPPAMKRQPAPLPMVI